MFLQKAIHQSLLLLLVCGFFEIVAGDILHHMLGGFILPGIIVLVPALLDMKGNIETTLGSRLGSATHMGLITKNDLLNREMRTNILASILLTVSMSFVAGLLAVFTSLLIGIDDVNFIAIVLVAILAGTMAGAFQASFTVLIMFIAFKRGYDPDNITGPALSTLGDLITIACIAFSIFVVRMLLGVVGIV